MRWRWTLLVWLCGILLLVGCGKDTGTIPVTGTVKLDGTAVEGASVIFTPAEGGGQAAAGLTDANGKYSLNCAAGPGALPGNYKVAITKKDPKDMAAASAAAQAAAGGGMDEASMDAAYGAAEKAAGGPLTGGERPIPKVGDMLPTIYSNPATSGLTKQVTAGGDNVHDFDLTSQ